MKYGLQLILFHILASIASFFFFCDSCNADSDVMNGDRDNEDSRDLVMGKKIERKEKEKEKRAIPLVSQTLRIAFCITGQLARLEILSKLKNVILPNVNLGHTTHLFLLLDDQVDNVKQTFWKFDYSKSLYGRYTAHKLQSFMDKKLMTFHHHNKVKTWVRLEPPSREYFETFYNESVPVTEKKFSGHDGSKNNYESAESRFQNNMRWMAGLRECAKWVQEKELELGLFYDVVVRLRDDSFAMGSWIFDSRIYLNNLVSLDLGSWRGINDHNFAIDRKWIDDFLRGLSEDYYLNHTKIEFWRNPEQHLLQVAEKYRINTKTVNFCDLPLVPLRGLLNRTYWRVHPLYVRYLHDSCPKLHQIEIDNNHNNGHENSVGNKSSQSNSIYHNKNDSSSSSSNHNNYDDHNQHNRNDDSKTNSKSNSNSNSDNNNNSNDNNSNKKGVKKKRRKLKGKIVDTKVNEEEKKVRIEEKDGNVEERLKEKVEKEVEGEDEEEGEEEVDVENEVEIPSCCPASWKDVVRTSVVRVHH